MFLDGVRVPVENRVGAENDGWRVTNVTLRFERGTAFASEMYNLQEFLRGLLALARATQVDAGRRLRTPACAASSGTSPRSSTRSGTCSSFRSARPGTRASRASAPRP